MYKMAYENNKNRYGDRLTSIRKVSLNVITTKLTFYQIILYLKSNLSLYLDTHRRL